MLRYSSLGLVLLLVLIVSTACGTSATPTLSLSTSVPTPAASQPSATDTPVPTATKIPSPTSSVIDVSIQTRTPTAIATEVLTSTTINLDCLQATFVADVTVPDNSKFEKGATFTKTWRIQNSGTCDWPVGTMLKFISGNKPSAPDTLPVGTVKVGTTVDLSLDMKAPDDDAAVDSLWQLQVGNQAFGNLYSVVIIVGNPVRRLTGRVMWWTTPVSNARVELKQSMASGAPVIAKTVSGKDGRFVFENPPAGDLAVFYYSPSEDYLPMNASQITVKGAIEIDPLYLRKKIQVLEPAPNARVGPTPTLHWTGFPGATKYEWAVYESTGAGSFNVQTTTNTSVAVSPALKRGTQYCYILQAWAETIPIANWSACFTVQP